MIFIQLHDNPDNIASDNDITLCLASFNPENISSLVKITFYIEGKICTVFFTMTGEIDSFPYSCSTICLTCEDMETVFQNFSKANKFVIERKVNSAIRRESVVNSYNSIDKIMLLGGYWR